MASSPPPSPHIRFSPPFCPFSIRQSTLPEHHSALSVIHQLDHSWFWDNVLDLPCFPSCLPIAPSSPPPPPPSPPPPTPSFPSKLLPFRSIELVQSLHPSLVGSNSNDSELPRARFERLPRRRTVEKDTDGSAKRSLQRRLRKQLGDIHIQVPRRQLLKAPLRERLVSNELAEESTSTHLGGPDDKKDFEPIPYKGNQAVEKLRATILETIASGKQLRACPDDTHETMIPVMRRQKRDRRKSSKSMTDLEVDELQGFMDLGFQFSKDDLTPRVVNLFPALRRQLGEDGEQGRSSRVTPLKANPYRSEAWLIRRPDSPLLNWRIPVPIEGRADMKEQLKFWARAVASTVRQEC